MSKRKFGELLEKDVRDPCVKYVKQFGDVKHKRMHFGYGAERAWPDDLFIFRNGHHWWIEFKGTGKEPTPLQYECHEKMREFNMDVSWFDDEQQFRIAYGARRGLHN